MKRRRLIRGNCLTVLPSMLEADSVDSIVTDPPYGLSFMGKDWDHGIPGPHFWTEALRVAKPGAYLVAFGGTRTYHRLTCAIEDAGWEIRDCLMWLYGQGFPKSMGLGKAIDKGAGAVRTVGPVDPARAGRLVNQRGDYRTGAGWSAGGRRITKDPPATEAAEQWEGWGTALKPAWEPIILARKPLEGTVAANVLKYGTGGLNIDGCRIPTSSLDAKAMERANTPGSGRMKAGGSPIGTFVRSSATGDLDTSKGRWPANVILDEEAGRMLDEQTGVFTTSKPGRVVRRTRTKAAVYFDHADVGREQVAYGDTGGASRFFYCAKASRRERREYNKHPTVKPLSLMRYLCRLVTPPRGWVLDPFMGSGSTGVAAELEGFRFVGVEQDRESFQTAVRRIKEKQS